MGGGEVIDVVQPHARHHVLGTLRGATHADASAAVAAAKAAAPGWQAMSFDDRAAILKDIAAAVATVKSGGPLRFAGPERPGLRNPPKFFYRLRE